MVERIIWYHVLDKIKEKCINFSYFVYHIPFCCWFVTENLFESFIHCRFVYKKDLNTSDTFDQIGIALKNRKNRKTEANKQNFHNPEKIRIKKPVRKPGTSFRNCKQKNHAWICNNGKKITRNKKQKTKTEKNWNNFGPYTKWK